MSDTDPFDFGPRPAERKPAPWEDGSPHAAARWDGYLPGGLADRPPSLQEMVITPQLEQAPSPVSGVAPAAEGMTKRGSALSWTALVVTVLASAVVGASLYAALASIKLSLHAVDDALTSLWISAAGLIGVILGLVLGIVALFRARPRRVAVLATVLSLVLPPACAFVGVQQGLGTLKENVSGDVQRGGAAALDTFQQSFADRGVDVGPLRRWLEQNTANP